MIKNIILINKLKNMNLWYMITNKQYKQYNNNKQYNNHKNNLIIIMILRYTQT